MTDLNVTFQTASYLIAALSFAVTCAYYVMNLNNNKKNQELALKAQQQSVETRQAQLYMQVLNQFDTLQFQQTWFEVMNWEFKTPEEFTEKIWPIQENKAKWAYAGLLLEGVGVAVNKNLISVDLIDDLFSGWVIGYWDKFGSVEVYFRERFKIPQNAEFVEYLYREVMRVAVKQNQITASANAQAQSFKGTDV